MWLRDKGLWFIPIPKTGTQSVRQVFKRYEDRQDRGGHPTYLDAKKFLENHTGKPPKFFSIVRKPDDRMVSAIRYAWLHHCQQLKTIGDPAEYVDAVITELTKIKSVYPIPSLRYEMAALPTLPNTYPSVNQDDWRQRWKETKFGRMSSFVYSGQAFWLEGSTVDVTLFKMDNLSDLINWLNENGVQVNQLPHKNDNAEFARRTGFNQEPVTEEMVRGHKLFDRMMERYHRDWYFYRSIK